MDISHIACHKHCASQIISLTQMQNVITQVQMLSRKTSDDISQAKTEKDSSGDQTTAAGQHTNLMELS
jgi:hypothetical protein